MLSLSTFGTFVVNWIDLIWLPITFFVATPRQRNWALMFVLLCAITMRMQIELIHSTGFDAGFTPLWQSDVKLRATLIYAVFCALYLVMLHYSPRSKWPVLLSASIVVYITAFTISMLLMVI